MIDISIISPTNSPKKLAQLLNQIQSQSHNGLAIELIIIQESYNQVPFRMVQSPILANATIIRSKPHYDYGCVARNLGLKSATGQYVVFWDDDNIYYNHAIAALYTTALDNDIGICRTYHLDMVIPIYDEPTMGDIDTMCICVKRDLALKEAWPTNKTKYSDFIYINNLMKHRPTIRHNKMIIGQHL
jgi:glycosyltransferase involved in cell wall biosynthesis